MKRRILIACLNVLGGLLLIVSIFIVMSVLKFPQYFQLSVLISFTYAFYCAAGYAICVFRQKVFQFKTFNYGLIFSIINTVAMITMCLYSYIHINNIDIKVLTAIMVIAFINCLYFGIFVFSVLKKIGVMVKEIKIIKRGGKNEIKKFS